VLVELSVMEQRYQAVLAVVQDGWKVVEVAERLGVGRTAAPTRPMRTSRRLICELRRAGLGPRRIEHQLGRAGIDPVSGRSSIYRCLKRHGLIELRRRRT